MRRLPFALLILVASFAALPAEAKDDQPWVKDPVVAEVLKAMDLIDKALLAHDVDSFASLLASDLVVNNPVNTVTHRADVLDRFGNDRISYSVYESKIEFAGVRGDSVVVMGEETVKPIGNALHAGKTVRRRFTDMWRKEDGAWKLGVRQATIISVE